jgi:hypothetical protein
MQTKFKLDPSIPSSPIVAVAIEQAKKDGVALPDVRDVYVLDAKTGKPVGTPGEAGLNVFGTVLLGHRQFATDVASGALTEIDRYTGEVIGKLDFSIDDPQNPGKKISLEPHQPGVGIDGKLYVPRRPPRFDARGRERAHARHEQALPRFAHLERAAVR